MKTYWGMEVQLYGFLTSVAYGGQWSASRYGCFTSEKRTSVTHWIGGRVGPKAFLEAVEKRKIFSPYRDSNSGRPARSIALY